MSNWWLKIQKNLSVGNIIIPIFLANDKTVISLSHRDQILWPIYVTIDNLNTKIYQSQNWLAILYLVSIHIIYKQTEDLNNQDGDLKTETSHLVLITIIEHM